MENQELLKTGKYVQKTEHSSQYIGDEVEVAGTYGYMKRVYSG